MSHVILFDETGGPEKLRIADRALPEPGPGEVRIRILASALNRAQLLYLAGHYAYPPSFPSTIGDEAVGIVDATGKSAARFKVGDRVSILSRTSMVAHGTHAEHALVEEASLIAAPEGLGDKEAAALWVAYLTAYGPLVETGALGPGKTVVITAASSSTGLAAIQIAKDIGAQAIVTTRTSAKKQALVDLGADIVIATDEEDVTAAIMAATGGKGADLVFDAVGGSLLGKLAFAVAPGGMIVTYGVLEDASLMAPVSVPAAALISKTLTFFSFLDLQLDPARLERGIDWVRAAIARGSIKPLIHATYPLEAAADALRAMEGGSQLGKILLIPAHS